MKKYDALYIFVNAVRDDAIEPLVEKVGADITRLGGKVLGSEMLGRKTFARVMKKKESGVYVPNGTSGVWPVGIKGHSRLRLPASHHRGIPSR